jgi:hypothetical protein
MYFSNDKQHLWCNFLTFFCKKKIKNKHLTNLTSHFFFFKNFKDFRIFTHIIDFKLGTIFYNWKFDSRSLLKRSTLLNDHFQIGLNDLTCLECRVKKKNGLTVSKFNPMFLVLVPKWAKFLFFMSIFKKIDSNFNKELSKNFKNNSKLILKNNCSGIGRWVKKLRDTSLITKFENFGFFKFKNNEIKNNFLFFFSKTYNYQDLPKLKTFRQISKFIFLQIFQPI